LQNALQRLVPEKGSQALEALDQFMPAS